MEAEPSARFGALAVIAACFATHSAVAFEGTTRAESPQPSDARWLISARGLGGLRLGATPPAPRAGVQQPRKQRHADED